MIWPTTETEIIDMILAHEGGWVDLPNDKGGPTNRGITLDTLASWRKHPVTKADLQAMSVDEARQIYDAKYRIDPGFDMLSSVRVQTISVDSSVLFGPYRAVQFIQAALSLTQDGALGPATLAAANKVDPRSLVNNIAVQRAKYHAQRVAKDASQLEFLVGWLNRAFSFIE